MPAEEEKPIGRYQYTYFRKNKVQIEAELFDLDRPDSDIFIVLQMAINKLKEQFKERENSYVPR